MKTYLLSEHTLLAGAKILTGRCRFWCCRHHATGVIPLHCHADKAGRMTARVQADEYHDYEASALISDILNP